MNSRTISIINVYILAISTLLAFTKCESSYDTLVLDSIKNVGATQSAQLQPNQTPQNYPPLCTYPPPSPSSSMPSTSLPPPKSPPSSSTPPSTALPAPIPPSTPPSTTLPTPPSTGLPGPTGPPTPPTPGSGKPEHGQWCVAKPSVPAPTIQQALDYACASGADCGPTQVGGACSQPDTVVAHASYAFNSYWQKNKSNGGTCDFGGSATIVTVDPSYDQCHFPLS